MTHIFQAVETAVLLTPVLPLSCTDELPGEMGGSPDQEAGQWRKGFFTNIHDRCLLAQQLAAHPGVRKGIKFYPNSTIYVSQDQPRYMEYRFGESIVSIQSAACGSNEFLSALLHGAAGGAFLHELAEILCDRDIPRDEALEYIEDLVESRILIGRLETMAMDPGFPEAAASILESVPGMEDTAAQLRSQVTAKSLPFLPGGSSEASISPGSAAGLAVSYRTEAIKPGGLFFQGEDMAGEVFEGMELLEKLDCSRLGSPLGNFKDAFMERYGGKRTLLVEVLDPDTGIGYRGTGSTPKAPETPAFREDILQSPFRGRYNPKLDRVRALLIKKLSQSMRDGSYEVAFTREELSGFTADWNRYPGVVSAVVQAVSPAGSHPGGPRVYLKSMEGARTANVLARYAAAGKEVRRLVKDVVEREAAAAPPGCLPVELLALPEPGYGNGNTFPPVERDYSLPYMAASTVPPGRGIDIADLWVSVIQDRVVLHSGSLGIEVIPRVGLADNYAYAGVPVYAFLKDMQRQYYKEEVRFDWRVFPGEYKFLPRLVYRRLIVSPARWNFKRNDLNAMYRVKDGPGLSSAVEDWRRRYRVPRRVWLEKGDTRSLFDLENSFSLKMFLREVEHRRAFGLEEFLFDGGQGCAGNGSGTFANELILVYMKCRG